MDTGASELDAGDYNSHFDADVVGGPKVNHDYFYVASACITVSYLGRGFRSILLDPNPAMGNWDMGHHGVFLFFFLGR